MEVRDFFRLLLKLFGLYLFLANLFALPGYLPFLISDPGGILEVIGYVSIGLAMLCLFLYLVFTPDKIINALKLHKGFSESRIDFEKLDGAAILKLGVILISGILFVSNVPALLIDLYRLMNAKSPQYNGVPLSTHDYIGFVTRILNVLVAIVLITNIGSVTRFLLRKQQVPID
jgi:hypothetical protein